MLLLGAIRKETKVDGAFLTLYINTVSSVRAAKIISVCFLWEINFWYSWRAVYLMNAKLIASGLSWS